MADPGVSNTSSLWTSLEIAKFIVSLTTPILVGIITYLIAKTGIKLEKLKTINHELIKCRIDTYKEVSPLINDIYCFFTFRGNWKNLYPKTILKAKRDSDKLLYINKALYSDTLFREYQVFSNCYFETWTGIGEDAKFRIEKEQFKRHWESNEKYEENWLSRLSSEVTPTKDLKNSYLRLMNQFATEIGIEKS